MLSGGARDGFGMALDKIRKGWRIPWAHGDPLAASPKL
jgi:hypothetical protein